MAITITTQPKSQTVYRGASVSLTCSASGGTNLSYTWYSGGSRVGTGKTIYPSTSSTGSRSYYCNVEDADTGMDKDSNTATITVQSTPTPSVSVRGGGSVYRGISAPCVCDASVTSGSLSYQWQYMYGMSWTNLSGQTSATYYPDTSEVGSYDNYRCVVTNTLNGYQTTANSSSLYVSVSDTPTPSVTTGADQSVYRGGTATVKVDATSLSGTLGYQWQSSDTGSSGWSNVSGGTSSSYSAPTSTVGTKYYRCRVTNTLGGYSKTATSSAIAVTVSNIPAPSVTAGSDQSVFRGATATVKVDASSTNGTLSYQWSYKAHTSNVWEEISGATSSSYKYKGTVAGEYDFRCVVTNTLNGYSRNVTSGTIGVTVKATPTPSVTPTGAGTYYKGDSVTVKVDATVTSGTLTYKWQSKVHTDSSYADISGATKSSYKLPSTTTVGSWDYRCTVTNTLNGYTKAVTTGAIAVTIEDTPTPTARIIGGGTTVYKGATVNLTCDASVAKGKLTYKWQYKTPTGTVWIDAGDTDNAATFKPSSAGTWNYRCQVTNTLNGYTKNATASTTVTVNDTPTPTVIGPVGGGTVYMGGTTKLSVTASSTSGTISYQWQSSTDNATWSDVSGATSKTMSPKNDKTGTYYYRVVVTNTLNGYTKSVNSDSVSVTVNATPSPSISSQSVDDATYYVNAQAQQMSCNATSASGSVSYQWQSSANGSSGWTNISGQTGKTYTPPTGAAGTTWYRCQITNSLNGYTKTTTTRTAKITVSAVPVPTITNPGTIKNASYYYQQASSAMDASATASAGVIEYQWQSSTDGTNWANMPGVTYPTYYPSTSEQGTTWYRCIVSNSLNGATAATTSPTAKITVNGAPAPNITQNPKSATYYLGDTAVQLTVVANSAVGYLTYQWQMASGAQWEDILGETDAYYTPDISNISQVSYRCHITNTLYDLTNTANTATAVITVKDTPSPVFTSAYSIRSATYKQNASASTMDGTATSEAGTLTYQWQRKNGNDWEDITGASSAKYKPNTATIGSETYRIVVTNTMNGLTKTLISDPAVITVDYATAPTPAFTSAYDIKSAEYYVGDTAKPMNATASSEAGAISYQWQKSTNGNTWTNISGATSNIYTPLTTSSGNTWYRCVVTNTYASTSATLTSNEAKVTVTATPSPVFSEPEAFTTYTYWQGAPNAARINGAATAERGSVTYQWQKSADGANWTDIASSIRSDYIPPTITVGTAYYRVIATNTLNRYSASTTSPTATVITNAAQAPTITSDPASATWNVAATPDPLTVAFTSATQPVTYQWQKSNNGASWENIDGATKSTYSPSTATAGTQYYRVILTAGYSGYTTQAESGSATITTVVPVPSVSALADGEYNLRANSLPLDPKARAAGCVLTYQWQRSDNGTSWSNISGATGATYEPPTNERGTVWYRCTVTATNNGQSQSTTTSAAEILVYGGQAPVFQRRLQSSVYKAGEGVRPLNGTASSQDTQNITYQWYWSRDNVNFLPVDGATGPYYTPSPTAGTTYYYVVARAYFIDGTTTSNRSNTATISVTNEKYDFGGSWRTYLETLKTSFTKLARLEFLQPDGSVAFALDNNPMNRRSGAFIQSGQITVNLQNGQRRTATVTLSNLDNEYDYNVNKVWFGQQILLSEGLILPNGQEFYLPQGVFYIRDPEEKLMPNNRSVTYHLEDKWSYLNGTLFGNLDGVYEIPLNTNIFEAIQSVLDLDRGNGQKVDSVPPVYTNYYNNQMTTLPGGSMISDLLLPYTYRNDGENGTYADIVLEMSNILAAWVGYDATGRLRIDPSQDDIVDASKPVQWEFRPDEKQFLGATYTVKNSDVFNDVIITGESLSGYGHIAGRAQNLDPSSDTNVNLIGLKTHKESAAGYYTEKQCESLAMFRLKQQTVLQKSVTIQSAQLFHINENQLVMIRRPDKPGAPMERHLVTGFTRPIAQTGAMQINATSVNDFLTATIVYPGGQTRTSAISVGTAVYGTMIVNNATAQ